MKSIGRDAPGGPERPADVAQVPMDAHLAELSSGLAGSTPPGRGPRARATALVRLGTTRLSASLDPVKRSEVETLTRSGRGWYGPSTFQDRWETVSGNQPRGHPSYLAGPFG